ncbi:hypothetical protein FACS189472_13070 [Alphaproteobacteria bacterium]|nr:hypothetical protein FACS189472_13070 [Alphaproteobacteria bacterium]
MDMAELDSDGILVKRPAKILVIDDSENARLLLKRRLSIHGYEVVAAESESRALEILAKVPVDVIFLNIFLNEESSLGFLTRLKSDDAYKNIPLIIVSSDSDVELFVSCIEAGADDYMVKPINQTLLKARLSNCIARKEAYDKEVAFLAQIEQGQKQIASQEKMASIGVLVSSISQELKNPLHFIINFSEVSAETCNEICEKIRIDKEKVEADMHEYLSEKLKKFQSNVQKITEYGRNADQILRFMFSQSNASEGKKHPASISKIVTQTIGMLKSSYKATGVTSLPLIETKLDTVPLFPLTVQAISKMIYNILDNAVYSVINKFDDVTEGNICVTTKNTEENIEIIIRDNGSGIKEDLQQKIFEPFFTTKPAGVGPGLGLSTSCEVASDHNGKITVTSIEGAFAEFTITISKQQEAESETAPQESAAESA